MMEADAAERVKVARLSRSLSGYLCGTHSGALGHRRGDRLSPHEISREQAALLPVDHSASETLECPRWDPRGEAASLAADLRVELLRDGVMDLIIFGSQAHGTATGFSDLDAVLLFSDDVVERPRQLPELRSAVLAAQRRILVHQPMQHHGFEVVTPRLLNWAVDATGLPIEAVADSRALRGGSLVARFDSGRAGELARSRLSHMARELAELDLWPRHPWRLHRVVSMFELLPTLYLQALGERVSKRESFAAAASRLGRARWWPYEVLSEVRETWPRRPRPGLKAAAAMAVNPWLAITAWTRLPAAPPRTAGELLTADCLSGLRQVARKMAEAGA